jgi:hypothetical protein
VKALPPTQAFAFDPPAAVPGAAFIERTRTQQTLEWIYQQHSDTLPRLMRAPKAQ